MFKAYLLLGFFCNLLQIQITMAMEHRTPGHNDNNLNGEAFHMPGSSFPLALNPGLVCNFELITLEYYKMVFIKQMAEESERNFMREIDGQIEPGVSFLILIPRNLYQDEDYMI
jgi:hypothetical protein